MTDDPRVEAAARALAPMVYPVWGSLEGSDFDDLAEDHQGRLIMLATEALAFCAALVRAQEARKGGEDG